MVKGNIISKIKKNDTSVHGEWSSTWGFILATTGAAVGLGKLWKFPYIAGSNGGGAFVLVYLLCIVLIGLPLLITELTLGRAGRQNPINTMEDIAVRSNRRKEWKYIGALCIIAGLLVLSFYSVIAGWGLHYIFEAAMGHFKNATAQEINTLFTSFVENPYRLLTFHTIIMMTTIGMVMFGVEKGIERALRFLFPCVLIILLILVLYSAYSGAFKESIIFLFKPDFHALTANGVLIALGQAFFTLSLAFGTIMMYGAYVPRNVSIPKTSLIVASGDTLIALLAGMAIFPIVFAYGLSPDSGPGLIFLTLPISFGSMPFGSFFATLFFIMLVFAALTTTVSFLEPITATLIEKIKISRTRATLIAGTGVWLFGFISVFSFNIWSGFTIFGLTLFDALDYLTSSIMLPLGGLSIAIFTGWRMKKALLIDELNIGKRFLFRGWYFCVRYIAPIAIIVIFLNVIGII